MESEHDYYLEYLDLDYECKQLCNQGQAMSERCQAISRRIGWLVKNGYARPY